MWGDVSACQGHGSAVTPLVSQELKSSPNIPRVSSAVVAVRGPGRAGRYDLASAMGVITTLAENSSHFVTSASCLYLLSDDV
jgi:hypothetical protein